MYKEEKYFIVEKDDLGEYGNEDGMTEAEAVAELETLDIDELANIVVIIGHIIQPQSTVKISFKDE